MPQLINRTLSKDQVNGKVFEDSTPMKNFNSLTSSEVAGSQKEVRDYRSLACVFTVVLAILALVCYFFGQEHQKICLVMGIFAICLVADLFIGFDTGKYNFPVLNTFFQKLVDLKSSIFTVFKTIIAAVF